MPWRLSYPNAAEKTVIQLKSFVEMKEAIKPWLS
jgi:hypothetical protein